LRLSRRLSVIEQTMSRVAERDLTVSAGVKAADETGELAAHINGVIQNLKIIIEDIKETAAVSMNLRDELGASTSESSAAMTQITAN
ncbi:MAG: HAMP domain-containing protein, partial [Gammaproteobacteria bacterium]|nr:HAMP domain-containing protein [Gammaproteobacteria bacterium]NIR95703.1 HAMP domain-containing protein [Gammaproteobacteria bacterium]